MSDIKVTVYCLAYNHEKYIRKALEGFVMQKTNFDYEVLVHDDASTDSTADIIREYEEKYPHLFKVIYQKENQFSKGASIKNHMLPLVRGKYIAYCEGDDYWVDENKLQTQYDIMEKYLEVSLCVHNVQCVTEDCSEQKEIIPEEKYGLNDSRLISSEEMASLLYDTSGYPFQTSSYFLRTEVAKAELNDVLKGYINGDGIKLRVAMYYGKVYFENTVMSHRRLWTSGNWNNRMKELGKEKQAAYLRKVVEGEILFDNATERRFHKWIVTNVYQKMYLTLRQCSMIETSKIINRYRTKHFFEFIGSKKLTKKMGKYYLWRIRTLLVKTH